MLHDVFFGWFLFIGRMLAYRISELCCTQPFFRHQNHWFPLLFDKYHKKILLLLMDRINRRVIFDAELKPIIFINNGKYSELFFSRLT